MYIYTSSNPCICSGSVSNPPDPSCPEECNCLTLCNISINALSDTAPEPCGGELILDVTDTEFGHDTCACGDNDLLWYVAYFDPLVFETVTINTAGTSLNATTVATSNSTNYSDIILRAVCGTLSAFVTVTVGIKDMCSLVTCEVDEVCNECTGICQPDTEVGVS